MPMYVPRRAPRWALAAIALAAATGCANLAPVSKFADQTKQVTAAFATMPTTAVSACRANQEMRQQFAPPTTAFDPDEARKVARELCRHTDAANADILLVGKLVEQYADTLAALANDKLPDYKAELAGLQGAVGGLKNDSGALIPSDKAAAIVSLGEFLARVATERAARSEIRTLLDQSEGFDAAADAMGWYAKRIYKDQVAAQRQVVDTVRTTHLVQAEKTQHLAARTMMLDAATERDRLVQLEEAQPRFAAAIETMKRTRAEVRAKFDHLDDAALLRQLGDYAKQVGALRKELRAAF
jgi:hypothetical protein